MPCPQLLNILNVKCCKCDKNGLVTTATVATFVAQNAKVNAAATAAMTTKKALFTGVCLTSRGLSLGTNGIKAPFANAEIATKGSAGPANFANRSCGVCDRRESFRAAFAAFMA
jgi:hypothetical protein